MINGFITLDETSLYDIDGGNWFTNFAEGIKYILLNARFSGPIIATF
jgi:hypothetical protein